MGFGTGLWFAAMAGPKCHKHTLAPAAQAGPRGSATRGVKKFGGEIDHAGQLPVGESGF